MPGLCFPDDRVLVRFATDGRLTMDTSVMASRVTTGDRSAPISDIAKSPIPAAGRGQRMVRILPGDMVKRLRKLREKWLVLANPQAMLIVALDKSVSRKSRMALSSLMRR